MTRAFLIFIVPLGLGVHWDWALGQRRLAQSRVQNAAQERRERRQAEQLVAEGAKLLQAGKKVLAVEKFNRALQLNPKNDQAHAYMAQIAWEEKRMVIAKNHVGQALKSNPQNVRAHLIAAQMLLQEGKSLAAYDHLRKASAKAKAEQDKREAGKMLARLRENHPTWFGSGKIAATPTPTPASATKSSSGQPTNTTPATPPKPPINGIRPNLAVFTFDEITPQQPEQGWGASLAEMLTTALINSGSYRLIERTQLQKVLEEQALGQSGALDAETAVVVGKIMNIDAIVVGSISALANAMEADARILNVETGEAIAAAHSRAASADELRQMAEALAKNIATQVGAVPAHAPADSTARIKK